MKYYIGIDRGGFMCAFSHRPVWREDQWMLTNDRYAVSLMPLLLNQRPPTSMPGDLYEVELSVLKVTMLEEKK